MVRGWTYNTIIAAEGVFCPVLMRVSAPMPSVAVRFYSEGQTRTMLRGHVLSVRRSRGVGTLWAVCLENRSFVAAYPHSLVTSLVPATRSTLYYCHHPSISGRGDTENKKNDDGLSAKTASVAAVSSAGCQTRVHFVRCDRHECYLPRIRFGFVSDDPPRTNQRL